MKKKSKSDEYNVRTVKRSRELSSDWLFAEVREFYDGFIRKNPAEQLEEVINGLPTGSKLGEFLEPYLSGLRSVSSEDGVSTSGLSFQLEAEIERLLRKNTRSWIHTLALLAYFETKNSPFSIGMNTRQLKKVGLTTKGFQDEVLGLISSMFETVAKSGPTNGPRVINRNIDILALYNRLRISIENARFDMRRHDKIKAKKPDTIKRRLTVANELVDKYAIPEKLVDLLFSNTQARELAIGYLSEYCGIGYEGMTKNIKRGQAEWKRIAVEWPSYLLVDVVRVGSKARYYAVSKSDREKYRQINFGSVPKYKLLMDDFEKGYLVITPL